MQSKSQSAAILRFLADGPKRLADVLRQSKGAAGSIKNRMSELRVAGLIEDTVTLTPEGMAALEKLNQSLSKRHERVRNHESKDDGY